MVEDHSDMAIANDNLMTKDLYQLKNQIEQAEKIFYKEISDKYFLLDRLTENQLKKMCNDLLGNVPEKEFHTDEFGKVIELPNIKEDYMHFLIDAFPLSEIQNYVLQNGILDKKFFES